MQIFINGQSVIEEGFEKSNFSIFQNFFIIIIIIIIFARRHSWLLEMGQSLLLRIFTFRFNQFFE